MAALRKCSLVAAFVLVLGLAPWRAEALVISVSDTQGQTVSGQNFNFAFAGLPSPGTGGIFELVMRGDYSGFTTESAVASIDMAGGQLDVGDTANGVISNSISGLSLISSNRTSFAFDDVLWEFSFSLSDALLNAAIADGLFTTNVNLDRGVNAFNPQTAFVRVGLNYTANVPAPGALALLGAGLAAFGFARRNRRLA